MRSRVAAVAVLALLSTLPPAAAAQAAPSAPTYAGPSQIAPAADFASDAYGDPWDFSQGTDLVLDRGPTQYTSYRKIAGGRLQWGSNRSSYVSLVFPGYHGALPFGRDGQKQKVDANTYRYAAVRMWSGSSRDMGAALFWDRCYRSYSDVCRGELNWTLRPGWHTYVIPLADLAAKGYGWAGTASALRLAVGPSAATDFAVDWVRLYKPSKGVKVSWANPSPGRNATLYWDNDTDPSNNTAGSWGWGAVPAPVRSTGSGTGSPGYVTSKNATATSTFPADAFPPGVYHFYAEVDGQRSAYSAPLRVGRSPLIRILDPDEAGGEDYATARRGDPWDFNQRADVASWGNATNVGFSGGAMHANNARPTMNDPFVWLKLASGGIDARRYHRMTIEFDYDGPFALEDVAGGGTHGRVVWFRNGDKSRVYETKEIVTYSGRRSYTFDLTTSPVAAVMEDDRPSRVGWPGTVTGLRWDPNEDRGSRRWRIHDVKLRADDQTRSGVFDIRWRDDAYMSSTRVSLYYDTTGSGFDGVPIVTNLGQGSGTNTYRWNTAKVPPGRYWIYAVASDGTASYRTYSSGPVVVGRERGPAATWSGWQGLADGAATGPAAASWSTERTDVVAVDGAGQLVHRAFAGGAWETAWRSLEAPSGLTLTSPPAIVAQRAGKLDVFARASDNALWTRSYANGQGWSAWTSLGGGLASGPTAASDRDGVVAVFVRGRDGAVWQKTLSGGRWGGWKSAGGVITAAPAATSWGRGRYDVFGRAPNGALYHRAYQSGRGWYPWRKLGGVLAPGVGPTAVAPAPGRIDLAVVGASGRAHPMSYTNGRGWTGFGNVGHPGDGVLRSSLALTSRSSAKLELFGLGGGGTISHSWVR